MASLYEIRENIEAIRRKLRLVSEEAGPERDFSKVKSLDGNNDADKLEHFRRLDSELNELCAEKERLEGIDAKLKLSDVQYANDRMPVNAPLHGNVEPDQWYGREGNIAKAMENSAAWKLLTERKAGTATLELPLTSLKATLVVGSMSPQAARQSTQPMGVEQRTVIDMVGTSQATSNSLDYYEETTAIAQAAVTAENTAKPEATMAWTLRTVPIVKVAVWIPVTKEALDDVPFLESQIRERLAFAVERVEESQVLTGTGAAGPPQLIRGLNNATGIQTTAKGANPTPDAIFVAMQLVRGSAGSGFAEPDGVVLHPNDWTDIKLLRTAAGEYIWGPPSSEGPDRIWGLPVRQTTAQTENTGLVGAFREGAEVYRREGISVTASTEHASYFIENKVALLAESRLGLAIWRPTAFCTVTGI